MKVIKIDIALLEQIYQNHRLAYKRGRVPKLFNRAKLYKKVAEAPGTCLLVGDRLTKF